MVVWCPLFLWWVASAVSFSLVGVLVLGGLRVDGSGSGRGWVVVALCLELCNCLRKGFCYVGS